MVINSVIFFTLILLIYRIYFFLPGLRVIEGQDFFQCFK